MTNIQDHKTSLHSTPNSQFRLVTWISKITKLPCTPDLTPSLTATVVATRHSTLNTSKPLHVCLPLATEKILSHWSIVVFMSVIIGWMKWQTVALWWGKFYDVSLITWQPPFEARGHTHMPISTREFVLPMPVYIVSCAIKINPIDLYYEYVTWF
jgi:hypothetical protein